VRQLSPQALQPQAAAAAVVVVEADLHLPIDKEHIASFRGPGGFSRPSIFLMKKTLSSLFILLFLFVSYLYAGNNDIEIDKILSSAESLFKAMKENNYPKIWTFLSAKSKNLIIDDVANAEEKTGRKYAKEDIGRDFAGGGQLARLYWNSYVEMFNPDLVLEESKWEMGKIEKDKAEIAIRHRKSEGPATLKMFKEEGKWVVGLEETFRSSRR
jgi:hypothetical protein